MIEVWNQFWFSGDKSFELSMARVVILGYFFFLLNVRRSLDLRAWQWAMSALRKYWSQPFLLKTLRVPLFDFRIGMLLVTAYKTALFFSVIGLFTQYSCAVALILGLYVLSMRDGLKLSHPYIPIHFMLFAFAFSPSGAHCSVDSLLFGSPIPGPSPAAAWGLQFIRVMITIGIFATGVAKVRHVSSLKSFIKPGSLSTLLRLHDFPYFYATRVMSISRLLKRFPAIEVPLSISVILSELTFPAVLFSETARILLVPGFIIAILAFRLFQGPLFDFFIAILIGGFVPWASLLS